MFLTKSQHSLNTTYNQTYLLSLLNISTTTYGFPNEFYRDGSEFETTSFSYSPRGFLTDFETLGELLTGSFSEGHTYTRDPFLGSMTHIDEAGGGPTLWNGLLGGDGLLTDLWTTHGIDSFTYDIDGAMTSFGDLELEYDQWNNLVTVHDTTSNQDYIESYVYDFANRLVGIISNDGYIDLWVHDGQRRAERWRATPRNARKLSSRGKISVQRANLSPADDATASSRSEKQPFSR